MKITYTRTGGFAPMPVSCSLDTETLDEAEARELSDLVRTSGIMQATSRTMQQARDVRKHTLHIDDNGESKKVTFDDISIPPEARPLILFLQSRAKNMFGDDD